MAHGMYHYLGQAWRKPSKELLRNNLIKWRRSEAAVRVDKPLRLDKARMLGYRAKKGFIVLRIRVVRGGRRRKRTGVKGRKAGRKQTIRKILKMNYRWVAEIRAARKYPSLEVLNSYNLGKDGRFYYFEVIMVDPNAPEVKSDRKLRWICNPKNRKRAERGLTSAAKKSRGLTSNRGKSPSLKVRPSLTSWKHLGK